MPETRTGAQIEEVGHRKGVGLADSHPLAYSQRPSPTSIHIRQWSLGPHSITPFRALT